MQAPTQQQQLLPLPQLPPLPELLHPVARVNAAICHNALRSAHMADILLTAFFNALWRIKIFDLPFEWHWTLGLRGQMAPCQDWFRWRLRIPQPTSWTNDGLAKFQIFAPLSLNDLISVLVLWHSTIKNSSTCTCNAYQHTDQCSHNM